MEKVFVANEAITKKNGLELCIFEFFYTTELPMFFPRQEPGGPQFVVERLPEPGNSIVAFEDSKRKFTFHVVTEECSKKMLAVERPDTSYVEDYETYIDVTKDYIKKIRGLLNSCK